jgi:hypothetical protein
VGNVQNALAYPAAHRRTHVEQKNCQNYRRQKTDCQPEKAYHYGVDDDPAGFRRGEQGFIVIKSHPGAAPNAAQDPVIFKREDKLADDWKIPIYNIVNDGYKNKQIQAPIPLKPG